ncbi:MAG: TonB family protein [Burkholderiaceae bacterium]
MKPGSFSPLQWALGASIAVHLLLLTVRWVDPIAFNRVFQDTALEVILVNARSQDRPRQAQAVAQHNLSGGGEPGQNRATSPLPPSSWLASGDALEDPSRRQLQAMQEQQTLLLAKVKQQLDSLPALPAPRAAQATAEQIEREEKRRELIDLLAEIERRIQQENARSKKRYVSPATREEIYALYYDTLRRSIETKGTENFPVAGGKKLYGELTMIVSVNHDGRLLATEVVQSSGNRILDRRAEAIAQSTAPFGPFSAQMKHQADQLHLISRFRFTRDDKLEAKLLTP